MKQHIPYILLLAVILLFAWAKDLRDQGVASERERVFVADIQRLTRRADSLTIRYVEARASADSSAQIARAAVARRGRVVASSDSVIARVDSVLATPAQPAGDLSPILADLRVAMLQERASSDSAIASLSSVVEAQASALSASDSLIAGLQEKIGAQDAMIRLLQTQAHPPLWRQATRALRWVMVGGILTLVLL